MRGRQDIEKKTKDKDGGLEYPGWGQWSNYEFQLLFLEVLLDCRELLMEISDKIK